MLIGSGDLKTPATVAIRDKTAPAISLPAVIRSPYFRVVSPARRTCRSVPGFFPSGSRKATAAADIRVPTLRTPLPILAPARTTGSAFLAALWTHSAPGLAFFLMNTAAS